MHDKDGPLPVKFSGTLFVKLFFVCFSIMLGISLIAHVVGEMQTMLCQFMGALRCG